MLGSADSKRVTDEFAENETDTVECEEFRVAGERTEFLTERSIAQK
jgi:hypothetical protein